MGNALCMGVILLAQVLDKSLPPRHSLIPGTNQKFLYIEDFWTMTYGDFLAIPCIVNAYAHLVAEDATNPWWGVLIMGVGALAFLVMCLGKKHKPDYGFPDIGKISYAGVLHLFYFGAGVAASIISVWHIFTGDLTGTPLWVGLCGGVIYMICFFRDIIDGNFNPVTWAILVKAPDPEPQPDSVSQE